MSEVKPASSCISSKIKHKVAQGGGWTSKLERQAFCGIFDENNNFCKKAKIDEEKQNSRIRGYAEEIKRCQGN